MLNYARQYTRTLRLWLLAATAILMLTSVLEAGHVHGVFAQADDQCTLCQHSVSIVGPLGSPAILLIPQLLLTIIFSLPGWFVPRPQTNPVPIRAPPAAPHTH